MPGFPVLPVKALEARVSSSRRGRRARRPEASSGERASPPVGAIPQTRCSRAGETRADHGHHH